MLTRCAFSWVAGVAAAGGLVPALVIGVGASDPVPVVMAVDVGVLGLAVASVSLPWSPVSVSLTASWAASLTEPQSVPGISAVLAAAAG